MRKLRGIVVGFIVWIIYRLISWTWRIELHEPDALRQHLKNRTAFLLAHFHGDEISLLFLLPRYRLATMISSSKDGEMMNTIFRLFGGRTSRGSSTRGGATALKGLLQLAKKGWSCSVAVDGPKGPVYEVKPGVFELSRLMKSEIFAGSAHCESAWRFPRSWNQTYFPKPFARVVIVWTGPMSPVTKDDDPRSPTLAKNLQDQLFAARRQAADLFGFSDLTR